MNNLKCFVICAVLGIIANNANSARILAVFPVPSISHQVVFQAYIKELARIGHELVIITPNPFASKENITNITEIDVSAAYEVIKNVMKSNSAAKKFRRGVVQDPIPENLTQLYKIVVQMFVEQFNQPEVQKLINSKEKFDLVVIEAFLEYSLIFSHVFKAPTILLSTFHGFPNVHDAIGSGTRHPIFYPHLQRTKFRDYTLLDRITETVTELRLKYSESVIEQYQNDALNNNFGHGTPTVQELQNNIDLLFLNSHPMITNNRPAPPNLVYLGGLHLKPIKDLPQDLKQYLDSSTQGVMYVSFGSNVKPENMDAELLNVFIEAFRKLPYNVLWKFDGDNLKELPKNLKIQKWFPQRDMLGHPNIKVFVTQGGLQSFDEAVDAAVPLIGIPMMNDQWYNINKFVDLGIGVALDALTLKTEDVVDAVQTVIKDDSYKKNMEKLRRIWYDQPQTAIERAIWWTEYVLRHGGARHLRAAAANVSWAEYWMIDVLAAFAIALFVIIIAIVLIVKRLLQFFIGKRKLKTN